MANNTKNGQAGLTTSLDATPISIETVMTELRVLPISDRLLGLYELALDGCAAEDGGQVTAVLQELISTLDFSHAEIAEGFFRLYTYCLEQTRDGHFDRVAFVVQDLHDTLEQAATDTGAPPVAKAAGQ